MDYVAEAANLAEEYGGTLPPLSEQPRIFLDTVWSQLDKGVIGLVTDDRYLDRATGEMKGTTISNWCYSEDRYDYDLSWPARHNADPVKTEKGVGSIYWQGASRKEDILGATDPTKARGSLDQLLAVAGYWCDFDCQEQNQPLSPVVRALLAMELPPTMIYFSGGGIQAVHLFSAPWDISDRALAKEYKSRSLAFYADLHKRVAMAPDLSVHEAARMMRLPGFVNRKPKRSGAVAHLIYLNPGNRYPLDDIKSRSPLPVKKQRKKSPRLDTGGDYAVSHNFIRFVVKGEQITGSRHEQIVKLAYEGRESGIPRDSLEERLLTLAKTVWYPEEPYRWSEIEQVINWAYEIAEHEETDYQGAYLVDSELRQQYNQEFEDGKRSNLKEVEFEPLPPGLELSDLREEQRDVIRAYLEEPTSRIATVLSVATPPGVGKTLITLQEVSNYLRAIGEKGLYLSQFKTDDPDQWVKDQTLEKKEVGFFIARNDDPNSPGYCAYTETANQLGAKGYSIQESLCRSCPLLKACQEGHYLSQFKALEETPLVVARFQHGLMEQITKDRKVVVIDESPLALIAAPITAELADLDIRRVEPFINDQYPENIALVAGFLAALKTALSGNTVQKGVYPTLENVKLGGYWLFARLVALYTSNQLERLLDLPNFLINNVNPVDGIPIEHLADSPPRFLQPLLEIMRFEYFRYYKQGVTEWNSRIVPYNATLRIYPMKAFSFTANTKVIVLDATDLPGLYRKVFLDRHSEDGKRKPRSRQLLRYTRKLKPRGKVVQITRTNASKKTVMYGKSEVDRLDVKLETPELVKALDSLGNYALGQLLILTEELSIKHHGNLLIVTYKGLVGGGDSESAFYARWLNENGIVAVDNVQWFGNLRGKNTWKKTEALLIVGTPRLQPVDIAIMSQVWYWDDPDPVRFDLAYRDYVYPGYSEDGKGRAVTYLGYDDPRVNEMYLNTFLSEGTQCATRTRLYTEDGEKVVYVVSDFPYTEHIDQAMPWKGKIIWLIAERVARDNPPLPMESEKDYTIRLGKLIQIEAAKYFPPSRATGDSLSRRAARNALDEAGYDRTSKHNNLLQWCNDNRDKLHLPRKMIAELAAKSVGFMPSEPTLRRAINECLSLA